MNRETQSEVTRRPETASDTNEICVSSEHRFETFAKQFHSNAPADVGFWCFYVGAALFLITSIFIAGLHCSS